MIHLAAYATILSWLRWRKYWAEIRSEIGYSLSHNHTHHYYHLQLPFHQKLQYVRDIPNVISPGIL